MLRLRLPSAVAMLAVASLLASCGGEEGFYRGENFQGNGKHQHAYPATPERVCEAARAVMLGQGYVLRAGGNLAPVGAKEFKDDDDRFAVLELHVSCMGAVKGAVLYATAIEAHFDAKKNKSSTSVGVPFTPLSISSSTTSEALVKTLGQTVEDRSFYESFYSAVTKKLGTLPK